MLWRTVQHFIWILISEQSMLSNPCNPCWICFCQESWTSALKNSTSPSPRRGRWRMETAWKSRVSPSGDSSAPEEVEEMDWSVLDWQRTKILRQSAAASDHFTSSIHKSDYFWTGQFVLSCEQFIREQQTSESLLNSFIHPNRLDQI